MVAKQPANKPPSILSQLAELHKQEQRVLLHIQHARTKEIRTQLEGVLWALRERIKEVQSHLK